MRLSEHERPTRTHFAILGMAWAGWLWTLPAALELWRRRGERPYEVVWIVIPLVAFSLFPTKRPNYMLPLVPPLALAAGAWWAGATDRSHGVLAVRRC